MIVQIYTMQSVEEAKAIVALGVDNLGITPSQHGLPGELSYELAGEIFAAVEGVATRVALSVDTDVDEIVKMTRIVKPDVLHLCGLSETRLKPPVLYSLRRALPGIRIMQAISVTGPESVMVALSYQDAADMLILDTEVSHIDGVGASGEVHDWAISREIVNRCCIPVILAGGLSHSNVQAAVKAVQPWGVDSLTHTNKKLETGGFLKDHEKIRLFVENANIGNS